MNGGYLRIRRDTYKNNSQIKTIHPNFDLRITYDTALSAQNRLPCGTWTDTA